MFWSFPFVSTIICWRLDHGTQHRRALCRHRHPASERETCEHRRTAFTGHKTAIWKQGEKAALCTGRFTMSNMMNVATTPGCYTRGEETTVPLAGRPLASYNHGKYYSICQSTLECSQSEDLGKYWRKDLVYYPGLSSLLYHSYCWNCFILSLNHTKI